MPSPFEGKRVLLLYKAASLCFDTPLFELSSLAGRVSVLMWGIPCVGEVPRDSFALCGKQAISVQ